MHASSLRRPLPLLFATGLLLALGCAGKDKKEDDTGGGGTGTDTLETPDINWSGVCPSATGLGTSTEWVYEYNEAFQKASLLSGGYTTRVDSVGDDGTLVVVTEIDTTGSNNTYTATQTNTYGCDGDGLWLLDSYLEYEVTVYYAYEGYQDYEWYSPVLLVPATVEVGDEWDSVYDGIYEDELGARRAQDYTVTTTVTSRESITVPAGEFTAMIWETLNTLGQRTTTYVANGTGAVATQEADLIEFTP